MIDRNSVKRFIPFLLLFVFFTSSALLSQDEVQADWELSKEKDGISVYTRLMKDSKFKEYKAICELDATPSQLVDILFNVKDYKEWMYGVISAEILEMDGENIFYVYSEVKVPFPFDNRDQVTKSVIHRDAVTGVQMIEVFIVPDFVPENKGIVRMESGRGTWEFFPLANGQTKAVHIFGGDPGGSIPTWVVNMFLVDGPIKTLTGLRDVVEELND
jgi:hypothetical protein